MNTSTTIDPHADEPDYEKKARAGLIPWTLDDTGEPIFLMMVASDVKFGGPRPMISKGKIEDDEDAFNCAIREAEEELGLCKENMLGDPEFLIQQRVVLRSGTYDLTLYSVRIMERWNFLPWCDETEYTLWMSLNDFKEEGRRDHIKFVEELYQKIKYRSFLNT